MSSWFQKNPKPVWIDEAKPVHQSLLGGFAKLLPEIEEIIGSNGTIQAAGYSYRAEQEQLSNSIMLALKHRRHLIGQAGTGTGKSLGYLVPALLYAMQTKTRAIVSTSTKNLQRQIVEHDLPLLRTTLGPKLIKQHGRNFNAAVLVGKSNYECQSRDCYEQCEHGSRHCYGAAWHKACRCDLLLVNHALLAYGYRNSKLPIHDSVIIDEAHQWPKWLRNGFVRHINRSKLSKFLNAVEGVLGDAATKHAVGPIRKLTQLLDQEVTLQARNSKRVFAGQFSPLVKEALEDLTKSLLVLEQDLGQMADTSPQAAMLLDRSVELRGHLADVWDRNYLLLPLETEGEMTGLEMQLVDLSQQSKAVMRSRPWIFVSATLTTSDKPETRFKFFQDMLGIESCHQLDVGSPFAYAKQQLYYVTETVVPPRRNFDRRATAQDFARLCGREYMELLQASQGRALLLFTSYEALNATAEAIQPGLPWPSRRQREDGEDQELIEWFKSTPGAVLFSASLWEGFDVPGPGLSLVVMDRVPLYPPDDPMLQARCELLCEGSKSRAFREISLPAGILQMKQGAGRLIRRGGDRGLVAIMDSRLRFDSKFSDVLGQMPGAPTLDRCIQRSQLPAVRAFIDWQPKKTGVA